MRSRAKSRYSNENFPLPAVQKLRALGHDVLTIQEAGKADQALPDKEVLSFATREGRAVLTLNRLHFIRLHRQQPEHAGIIVCKFDPDFDAQAVRIADAIAGQASLAGKLLRVNRGG